MNISLGQQLGQNLNLTLKTAGTYTPEDIVVTGEVQSGSFTNAAVTGTSYTEDTSTNTILPAGGALYLNAGYYPATKITLGHMIPDIASNDAGVSHILNGYKAYDEKGQLITGTMSTVTPSFTGGRVTATAGGRVTTAPKVTITQNITPAATSTYGFVSIKPSGTDGTNYLTIDAVGSSSSGSVTATANASSADVVFASAIAGFVDKAANDVALSGQNAQQVTASVTVKPDIIDDAVVFVPIVKPTFAGGTVSGSASVAVTQPTVTVSTTMSQGASDYGVTTTQPASGEFISINVSKSSTNGKATPSGSASRGAVTFSNSAGAIKSNSGATALTVSSSITLSGTEKDIIPSITATNFKTHYIPKATIKAVPGTPTITKPTASASVSVADNAGATVSGLLTSAPSGDYLKITPGLETTAGSAKSTASAATEGAGVVSASTTGGTVSGSVATVSVTNNTPTTAARYIKIYDGSYTLS